MINTEEGVLYLGVEDNGDISGVHKKHKDTNGDSADSNSYEQDDYCDIG